MNNKQIGKIFENIRKDKQIPQNILCKNIVTQAVLSRFEQGSKTVNCLVFNALMQRLGEDPTKFTVLVSKKEYSYLNWRDSILAKLSRNECTNDEFKTPIATDYTLNKNIQEQFTEFYSGYIEDNIEKMEHAIEITVPEYKDEFNLSCRYSGDELLYIELYIAKASQKAGCLSDKNRKMLEFIFHYIDSNLSLFLKDNLYEKAALIYAKFAPKEYIDKKIRLCRNSLNIKKKTGRVQGIEELICALEELYKEIKKDLPEEDTNILEAIRLIKSDFKVKVNSDYFAFGYQEYYLLNEAIKNYRIRNGLSVKEFVKKCGISEHNYRDIEKGKQEVKKNMYSILSNALNMNIGKYNADIIADNYSELLIIDEIKEQARLNNLNQALELVNILEKMLGEKTHLPENKQFIKGMRDIINLLDGQISPNDYLVENDITLGLTIPNVKATTCCINYTRMEMMLSYYKAYTLSLLHQYDEGIDILDGIWFFLRDSKVNLVCRQQEIIFGLNLIKRLLIKQKRYKDALKIARMGIGYIFKTNKAEKLHDFIFSYASVAELAEEQSFKTKERNRQYLQAALSFCQFFMVHCDQQVIENKLAQIKEDHGLNGNSIS